ncbi:MAG TPA: sugar phosphate nucleotidyltransferase [Burkholderiales bacterium]|nr:sugar phosphate nucleotidyltransferase [Burkholderiales bacterium]
MKREVLVLCGGQGTRLRSVVGDRPKGLADIAGRAFLDILVDELLAQGFRRLVLCTGYGAEQIQRHFSRRLDAEFLFSAEPQPLGTGGAVRHALPLVHADIFVVANGDSFCRVEYADLFRLHERTRAAASVVLTPATGRTDVGFAEVAADGRVVSFNEKRASTPLVNAGIYVFARPFIERQPAGAAFSLERELLPQAIGAGTCYGHVVPGPLVDIGTPERYRAAQRLLS